MENKSDLFRYMRTAVIPIVLTLSLSFAAIACGGESTRPVEAEGKLYIVATTGQVGDAARIIGGEYVYVDTLMGPGVDPHLYNPTAGDIEQMAAADLILYSGLHLEGKMAELFEQMGQRTSTFAAAGAIPEEMLIHNETFAGSVDPHVWFDVSMWMIAVGGIRDALVDADPENGAAYNDNYDVYLVELYEMDVYVESRAGELDESQRILVTAHDAFEYFGRRYGFSVRGLQGISTATEAGTADVRSLAEYVVENKVPAMFVETSVPIRNIEAVQSAIEDRGFNIVIGGSLYSDALGDTGTEEGTYLGVIRYNIDTIIDALSIGNVESQ